MSNPLSPLQHNATTARLRPRRQRPQPHAGDEQAPHQHPNRDVVRRVPGQASGRGHHALAARAPGAGAGTPANLWAAGRMRGMTGSGQAVAYSSRGRCDVKMMSIALVLALAGAPASALAGNGPPPPLVESVEPASGPASGGTTITITGSYFRAGATLALGNVDAKDVTVISWWKLRAVTRPHPPGAVVVTVTTRDGRSGKWDGKFTYVADELGATMPWRRAGQKDDARDALQLADPDSRGAGLAAKDGEPGASAVVRGAGHGYCENRGPRWSAPTASMAKTATVTATACRPHARSQDVAAPPAFGREKAKPAARAP